MVVYLSDLLIPAGCVEKIGGVLGLLEERSSFKGSAGDEMRGAVCFFIERVSDAGVMIIMIHV